LEEGDGAMMVEVIALVGGRAANVRAGDVYIGRPGRFGNPFAIGRDGDRSEVIAKFEAWIASRPALVEQLRALEPERLVCFCSPLPCHGDVYKRLLEEKGK